MIQLAFDGAHIGADLRIGSDVSFDQVAEPKVPAVVFRLLLHNCNKLTKGLSGCFARKVFVSRALKSALENSAAIGCNELLDGFFFTAPDAADQF
ncbi:MAG: hypothetical protein CVV04_09705 [Firmicutes bacterium HGW-Firmicutes-9]|nr:MAG: hypothetical protein CVV04_09705 [Firmicutes bacterium HGW-Firmicutes-9]